KGCDQKSGCAHNCWLLWSGYTGFSSRYSTRVGAQGTEAALTIVYFYLFLIRECVMFNLHPRLDDDTVVVGRFPLSLLLLSKDANYPWCVLVPEREDLFEIHHLSAEDQQQLMRESCQLAEV